MIYDTDPYLMPFRTAIDVRHARILQTRDAMAAGGSLSAGVNNHLFYGLHHTEDGGWVFREWAPNATRIYLVGDFNNWHRTEGYALKPTGGGNWEITLREIHRHCENCLGHPVPYEALIGIMLIYSFQLYEHHGELYTNLSNASLLTGCLSLQTLSTFTLWPEAISPCVTLFIASVPPSTGG